MGDELITSAREEQRVSSPSIKIAKDKAMLANKMMYLFITSLHFAYQE